MRVAVERGTGIVEDFLVSLFSGVGGGEDERHGGRELDAVFGFLSEGAVAVVGINLVEDADGPVVGGDVAVLRVDIAGDIVLSPQMERRSVCGIGLHVFVGADADTGDALALGTCGRSWSGLVVVVHNVDGHAFTSVTAVATEVVDDIVAHVHAFVELCRGARAETWCARRVVSDEVVVERSAGAAPVATVTMGSLGVS